jgi:hypothetical protein
MTARDVLREHLPELDGFLVEVSTASTDDARQLELQRVSKLIRFLRNFYTVYLRESLEVRVRGFSYKDKRLVSRQLIRAEDQAASAPADEALRTRLELAARFEDFSDLLHTNLEFGYSDEDDDYEVFHREAFPGWLAAVEEWLRASGDFDDQELAAKIHQRRDKYSDVIATTY